MSGSNDGITGALKSVNDKFEQIKMCSNIFLQRNYLAHLSSYILDNLDKTMRIDKLLMQLALMLIYFHMDDIKAAKSIHARVKQNTMQLSWWEKNGGKAKEYSWIAVGTVGAALVSVIPSPAPRMIALKKGMDAGKEAARKHQMNVEIAEEYFVALRNAIASIEFL